MDRVPPLTPESFPGALARGLGRCVLHLRAVGDVAPYRAMLLESFQKNLTFDPQCEGSRKGYLLDLARAASMLEELRSVAIEALSGEGEIRDQEQAIDVLVAFAEDGEDGCEEALRMCFDRSCWDEPLFGALSWSEVALHGTRGLLRVARKLGEAPSLWERTGNGAYLRSIAEDDCGAEEVERVLREAAGKEPLVAAFLEALEAEKSRVYSPRKAPTTLDGLLAEMQSYAARKVRYLGPFDWAKFASTDEQNKAIVLLSTSSDPNLRRVLLRALSRASVEVPCSLLIQLAEQSEEALSDAAQRALSGRSASEVRAFIERSLALEPPRLGAIRALKSCYQLGDGARILKLLERAPTEAGELHSLGLGLLEALSGEGRGEDVIEPLLWLYERGPCSLCRRDAVQTLDALGAVPGWVTRSAPGIVIRRSVNSPQS